MRPWIASTGLLVAFALATAAPALAGDSGSSAWVRLNALLGNSSAHDNFKLIRVADLASLRADANSHVVILDANLPRERRQYGVIPGARLLPSAEHYDVAAELPSDRDAKLVFYCANTR
jgi:Rhodanese-like domain